MTPVVADASVVVKWYVPEIHSAEAQRLQGESFEVHAPDLLPAEFGNILWKKVREGTITADEAERIIADFQTAPVKLYAALQLLPSAFRIANDTGRTVYDSLYLALALVLGCALVTADRRFYNALQGTGYAASLLWIEDV